VANINVTIVFDPSNNSWSITGDSLEGTTIVVNDRGANPIRWDIGLAANATGAIAFDATTGIVFTSDIPGDPPTGNANNWRWSLNNQLAPGTQENYEYQVNAWYTPAGGTQQSKQWDPDVEENPPSVALKAR
jgi:hypothetical protein